MKSQAHHILLGILQTIDGSATRKQGEHAKKNWLSVLCHTGADDPSWLILCFFWGEGWSRKLAVASWIYSCFRKGTGRGSDFSLEPPPSSPGSLGRCWKQMVTGSNPARSLGNLYSACPNPLKIPSCFQAHVNLSFRSPPPWASSNANHLRTGWRTEFAGPLPIQFVGKNAWTTLGFWLQFFRSSIHWSMGWLRGIHDDRHPNPDPLGVLLHAGSDGRHSAWRQLRHVWPGFSFNIPFPSPVLDLIPLVWPQRCVNPLDMVSGGCLMWDYSFWGHDFN